MSSFKDDVVMAGEFQVSIPGDALRADQDQPEKESGKKGKKKAKKPDMHNIELGRRGEEAAVRFLERRGYDVIERNWCCDAGEADIIVLDDDCLVFVEVKTRLDEDRGLPEDAVGSQKRKKYERIAASYLRTVDIQEMQIRFDVIAILVLGPDRAMIRHHINAFGIA